MPRKPSNPKPAPRILQLVRDPTSWAHGLHPAQAERVASWLQANGFFDPCPTCDA